MPLSGPKWAGLNAAEIISIRQDLLRQWRRIAKKILFLAYRYVRMVAWQNENEIIWEHFPGIQMTASGSPSLTNDLPSRRFPGYEPAHRPENCRHDRPGAMKETVTEYATGQWGCFRECRTCGKRWLVARGTTAMDLARTPENCHHDQPGAIREQVMEYVAGQWGTFRECQMCGKRWQKCDLRGVPLEPTWSGRIPTAGAASAPPATAEPSLEPPRSWRPVPATPPWRSSRRQSLSAAASSAPQAAPPPSGTAAASSAPRSSPHAPRTSATAAIPSRTSATPRTAPASRIAATSATRMEPISLPASSAHPHPERNRRGPISLPASSAHPHQERNRRGLCLIPSTATTAPTAPTAPAAPPSLDPDVALLIQNLSVELDTANRYLGEVRRGLAQARATARPVDPALVRLIHNVHSEVCHPRPPAEENPAPSVVDLTAGEGENAEDAATSDFSGWEVPHHWNMSQTFEDSATMSAQAAVSADLSLPLEEDSPTTASAPAAAMEEDSPETASIPAAAAMEEDSQGTATPTMEEDN